MEGFDRERCDQFNSRIKKLEEQMNGNGKDGVLMELVSLKIWKEGEDKRRDRMQRKLDAFTVVMFSQTLAFIYFIIQSLLK